MEVGRGPVGAPQRRRVETVAEIIGRPEAEVVELAVREGRCRVADVAAGDGEERPAPCDRGGIDIAVGARGAVGMRQVGRDRALDVRHRHEALEPLAGADAVGQVGAHAAPHRGRRVVGILQRLVVLRVAEAVVGQVPVEAVARGVLLVAARAAEPVLVGDAAVVGHQLAFAPLGHFLHRPERDGGAERAGLGVEHRHRVAEIIRDEQLAGRLAQRERARAEPAGGQAAGDVPRREDLNVLLQALDLRRGLRRGGELERGGQVDDRHLVDAGEADVKAFGVGRQREAAGIGRAGEQLVEQQGDAPVRLGEIEHRKPVGIDPAALHLHRRHLVVRDEIGHEGPVAVRAAGDLAQHRGAAQVVVPGLAAALRVEDGDPGRQPVGDQEPRAVGGEGREPRLAAHRRLRERAAGLSVEDGHGAGDHVGHEQPGAVGGRSHRSPGAIAVVRPPSGARVG